MAANTASPSNGCGPEPIGEQIDGLERALAAHDPDGSGDPGIASWSGTGANGMLNLLYMMVPLSTAGNFRVHTYFSGSIYVDVWGYVL